jgi:signal transduction histidine kinase
MTEEVQTKIFKPFFTTKADGEGTGLGLYICSNIIKEHGGSILLESMPGEGTTFRIRLPAK